MKKPTGKIGPYSAHIDEQGEVHGEFKKIEFPTDKDDIESLIVSKFIEEGKAKFKKYFFISNPEKNQLDDIDFNVKTPKGTAYLELMEIAPLDLYQGGHEEAPNTYDRLELAKYTHSKILAKSQKYPPKLKHELFLLLYITNFKFVLSDTTKTLLSYFCSESSLKFDVIFLLTPREGKISSELNWIYPVEKDRFKGFDPQKYKGTVMNLDPQKFEVFIK